MTKSTLVKVAVSSGFLLVAVVGGNAARAKLGFSQLSNGRGGANVEAVVVPDGFDNARSLAAFKDTVYPVLRAHCAACHSSENESGAGAQAPLHADADANLAHEYALTRVNFREPENSKLVVRMAIERHHCFGDSCAAAAATMLSAVTAWRNKIVATIPAVPPGVDQGTKISDAQVLNWISADKAKTKEADREFIKYVSFHVLHNAGVSPLDMNQARVGLSKALNTAARWAPRIVNPVDVNGKGILYKFDIRDYWGNTLIDTSDPNFALFYGGSDDDLSFAKSKVDLNGKPIKYAALTQQFHKLKPEVTRDDKFARLVWARILKGNAEASTGIQVLGGGNVIDSAESAPPNIDGFVGARKMGGNKEEYVDPEDFQYAEASQLTYTLTRPDVYNAVMAIPGYLYKFEEELGVDKSRGMDSFDYMVTRRAITIDSRFMLRAQTRNGGFYWKTFDIFTQGSDDIDQAYQKGDVTNPFWSHPIPKFISNQGGTTPQDLSYVATLELGKYSFDPKGSVGRYTGNDGAQQSAEEIIWSLPNGLQGYGLMGAWSQRRVDAFTKIVRDPRIQRGVADKTNSSFTGDGFGAAVADQRLINASSCIGCHTDGMNRANNDLRDWLDEGGARLPKGEYGADAWLKDPETVARVRQLYKPSSVMREKIENDRRVFLDAMAQIKQGMILGVDKNVYVEPTIWTVEWAQHHYNYPITRSN